MGLGSFFNKISHGAKNFFHKVDHGANNFFHKTVPHIAKKVGGGLDQAGNAIVNTAKKVGNVLEKNSAIIGDVGAGISMALGQPELAALSLSAGNIGQDVGSQLKRGSNQVQRATNMIKSNLNQGVGVAQNQYANVRNQASNMNISR